MLLVLMAGVPTRVMAQNLSNDATLSALAVSPKDITGFDPGRAFYEVGVASTVTRATVMATAADANAAVAITPEDADDETGGHQVDLSAGRNAVTVTVTAEDGVTTRDYTVSVNRGVTALTGWKAVDDLDGLIAAGNNSPKGIWSDGATIWVSDDEDAKLYAYRMSDGARDDAKDFDTLSDAGNNNPFGIWSDGATMWVSDTEDAKLYAYRMSDGARDDAKDFNTLSDAGNNFPTGIWSDGATMWVSDNAGKLYAYEISYEISHEMFYGRRDSAKDFDTLRAADHYFPSGIWSDGTTMWVGNDSAKKLYAYRMSDRARDDAKDFDTLRAAGNNSPTGIWSDGRDHVGRGHRPQGLLLQRPGLHSPQQVLADGGRGRYDGPVLHGEAVPPAVGGGDRHHHRPRRHRPHPGRDHADLLHHHLERRADGDGDGGR